MGDMTEVFTAGVRDRFERARETRAHSEESVAAGRGFVAAYVELLVRTASVVTHAIRSLG